MTNTNTLMKSGIWSPQKLKRLLLQNREYVLEQRQKEISVGERIECMRFLGTAYNKRGRPIYGRFARTELFRHYFGITNGERDYSTRTT